MEFLHFLWDSHGQQCTSSNINRYSSSTDVQPWLRTADAFLECIFNGWSCHSTQMHRNSVIAQMLASSPPCACENGHLNTVPLLLKAEKIFASNRHFSQMHKTLCSCWASLVSEVTAVWLLYEFLGGHLKDSHCNAQIIFSQKALTL